MARPKLVSALFGQKSTAARDYDRLKARLKIDKDDLDTELIEQAPLYQEVSEAHADAISTRDAAKEDHAKVAARVAYELRKAKAASGDKCNETMVSDETTLDPRFQESVEKVARAIREAAVLGALKDSFDQRGKMLRELASLYLGGYWQRNHVKGGTRDSDNASAAYARSEMSRKRRISTND